MFRNNNFPYVFTLLDKILVDRRSTIKIRQERIIDASNTTDMYWNLSINQK